MNLEVLLTQFLKHIADFPDPKKNIASNKERLTHTSIHNA